MTETTELPESLTFEAAMRQLEEILETMEGDRLPLDTLLESYEAGVQLVQICRDRLEAARLRVEKVTLGRGAPEANASGTEPFSPSQEAAVASPNPRPKRNINPRQISSGEDTLL